MLELNTSILKQAINNAKHMVDHKIIGYTEVPHCKGCVAGQYFWSLQDDDKIRLWDVAKEENVQCACMAVWVMIDKVFKKNIYSKDKFEDCCEFGNEPIIGCRYPDYEYVDHLMKKRVARI